MGKIKNIAGIAGCLTLGAAAGAIAECIKQEKRIDVYEDQQKKMKCFYDLLVQWVSLKQDGKNLAEYFEINEYKTVALYGMKELGERFIEELKNTTVKVEYIVDKNISNIVSPLPCYCPSDSLPKVDVMVVSAIYYYQDIEEEISAQVDFPIVSLEDVVYGLA